MAAIAKVAHQNGERQIVHAISPSPVRLNMCLTFEAEALKLYCLVWACHTTTMRMHLIVLAPTDVESY